MTKESCGEKADVLLYARREGSSERRGEAQAKLRLGVFAGIELIITTFHQAQNLFSSRTHLGTVASYKLINLSP